MRLPRATGILLHPTSLPGRFGIGDMGPQAHAFVKVLADAGQRWWQILPIGPTGFGNSPYQSYSSYAGNPLLISPELLVEDGWLETRELAAYPALSEHEVEFDAVTSAKEELHRRAFTRFQPDHLEFGAFVEENAHWLDDYALFMALKESHGGTAWYDWEPEIVRREPNALALQREALRDSVLYYQFVQYAFDRQWKAFRKTCEQHDVHLIGDLPIFVAQDSADVWARPDLFQLDENGRPTVVAGVPPDYFSEDGQLWGNPLYRWEAHAAEKFAWWIDRMKALTNRVDLVRLDHFRGFEAYWEVPAEAETAATGRWALGPGTAFLDALREGLDGLPIIAEDLGDITVEVEALRDRFALPGMRVIQFGFGGNSGSEIHLPHRYINHCVAYTGTHDNETMVGWFDTAHDESTQSHAQVLAERAYARRYLGTQAAEPHWEMIRVVMASVADTTVFPLQDILGLNGKARMNVPGQAKGNWGWRFQASELDPRLLAKLADLTAVYSRWNGEPPDEYRVIRRQVVEEPKLVR